MEQNKICEIEGEPISPGVFSRAHLAKLFHKIILQGPEDLGIGNNLKLGAHDRRNRGVVEIGTCLISNWNHV